MSRWGPSMMELESLGFLKRYRARQRRISSDDLCDEFEITISFTLSLRVHRTKVEYSSRLRKWLPDDIVNVPSIKESLSSIIVDAVKLPYVATSIHGGIKTGNSYQTLFLGEGGRTTGRYDRMSYLSRINFREKSVLDLGANTGEMSRSVRALGARLVDGYEYDPYFVEIGRAANALVGATRVSLFQGDCTRAALYDNFHYDIVLALNVWVYIEGVISSHQRHCATCCF